MDINSSYPERLFKESNQVDDESSKTVKNSLHGKCASNQLDLLTERVDNSFKNYGVVLINLEQRVDELSEEYDTVLKTHGDTLEQHTERITINEGNIDSISADVKDLQIKVAAIYQFINSAAPGTFFKIIEELKNMETEKVHNGSNFCGNCIHANSRDGICTCALNKGFVDPDDSSCEWFEPPF